MAASWPFPLKRGHGALLREVGDRLRPARRQAGLPQEALVHYADLYRTCQGQKAVAQIEPSDQGCDDDFRAPSGQHSWALS